MADIGTIVENKRTINLVGNARCIVPCVALATSWAVLSITGAVAGTSYTISCGGQAVKLTIGSDGTAKMLLTPFMTQAVASAYDCPLPTDGGSTKIENKWRGILLVSVATGSQSIDIDIPFIYGGANPNRQVQDRYLDIIASGNMGSWTTLDFAQWFNSDGTLDAQYEQEFLANNFNLNQLFRLPQGDAVEQVNVAMFNRGRITFAPMTLHLRYDCREEDTMLVKWLDGQGGINTRRFTFAGESEGGATDSTYNRFHWTKEKVTEGDGYWAGLDKWAQRTATKQITIGDDGIPQDQFSWIASLVQSSCVEVFAETAKGDMIWQRCNVVDSALERDPRKDVFSATISLELAPLYQPQQF